MSNKSGISGQVISLPQGGGALQGIGETFSPDLHTGTGNFTVPIALPSGRNGFQPQLSLVYSTGNGNSSWGLGWGLSIPGVMRKTSQGIPRYDDEQDTFVLSGAEDLVPIERLPGLTRYRPRTEGLFARIEHHRDGSNDYWKVWSKDGLVSFYGTPRAENESDSWQDPAVVTDPSDRSKVFAWNLSLTLDPFGNRIEYRYDRDVSAEDDPENDPHYWDQLYLSEIEYADYADRDDPQFLVKVRFGYEDRPDPFSEYRSGFEIRTRQRCREIVVLTNANGEIPVRSYQFVYLDQRDDLENLNQRLPLNGVSLLSQVRVVGHDDNNLDPEQRRESLPPLEFDYTRFEPVGRDLFPLEGRDLPVRSLSAPELELADLFGNGLPDILEMNGTVRYWRNLGNGRFDLPREMRTAPAGLTLASPGVQLIDANGDGRIDLLVTSDRLSGYFPLRFGGLWDRKSFQRYDVAPSFNLADPEVQLVDLTGDGVTDVIRSGSRLECFFNDPHAGWTETRWVERQDIRKFPNVNFSEPRVKWGDMSGDGLQDILLVHDGNIEYWPNLGYGNWGKRISMRNSPRFAYGYDPRRVLIGDIDGDGLDDIVYVDYNKVILWINQSGNGWSDPIEIKGTPPVSDMDGVRLVDLLGTGIAGVLWSTDANQLDRHHLYFLDFTGGVKPYLLSEMNNHMGALTRVGYAPSIRFYLEDEARPATRWKTPLPFPVQVVATVEVIDQISRGKLTTEYRYHHGYWDGAEREFRGFGRVEQLDTETFEDYNQAGLHGGAIPFELVDGDRIQFSPPTLTKTWFHQGPIGDEFGEWEEVNYSDEYWLGNPQVLERPSEMTEFLNGLPRRAKREALRTLRGQVLRTELYALDGTDQQERPYTVTESVNGVREETPPNLGDTERLRIFFPHSLAQRTTQWERGEEPMTQFSFTADYDDYGQPRQQVAIACSRQWRAWADERRDYLATFTETSFSQRDEDQVYMVDRARAATSYELRMDGNVPLITVDQLRQDALAGIISRQLINQSFNFYDGAAFEGLPLGELGNFGALVRTETLVLTEAILQEAYRSGDSVLNPPEMPPYLEPSGNPTWMDEYPESFREQLLSLAGYVFHPGDDEHERGYFVTTARQSYDFQSDADGQGRGLLRVTRDPFGRDTAIAYDEFDLLPLTVTDPVGLTTQAEYDYRVMQPNQVSDPNGNRQAFTFSPLGLLTSTAVMGKEGEKVGDTPEVPGTRLVYDFLAFTERQQPISVRTIRREEHFWEVIRAENEQRSQNNQPLLTESEIEALFPEDEIEQFLERFIQSREYSDGFGRLLQTRTQAEEEVFGEFPFGGDVGLPMDQSAAIADAVGQVVASEASPTVVVSGWQIYDNKGRVVEKYEPFYSTGWEYAQPLEEEMGQKATMFYDPRGQVIRTLNPDGSEQRVIYGVPVDLSNPEQFTPTPWEAYTYDANDLAPISNRSLEDGTLIPLTDRAPAHHHFTPSSAVIDALGRTIEIVERNGTDPNDWYITRSTYDIRGNLLTVTDALGREAFRYLYDLANNPLRTESIDAGTKRIILDANGNAIERRDSKGTLVLQAYDLLNRPTQLWTRDDADSQMTLREILEYGDGSSPAQSEADRTAARELNRLGQLVQHYDEAGQLSFEEFDFKGNLLAKVRRVIADAPIRAVFESAAANNWQVNAFRVNWEVPNGASLESHAETLLNPTEYVTSMTYDALNRVKVMRYPEDVEGTRRELRPQYHRAGALEQVRLNDEVYVERIAYNAKGQRILIAYGNGVMTRYVYDSETFRLRRLRSDRYTQPDPLTYRPTGAPLQDFGYEYDLVGNITTISDRTPESGILNSQLGQDALDRAFSYDAIYRLLTATGRECDRPPESPPWDDQPRCVDLTRTRAYREQYQYNSVSNMLQLRHEHFESDGSMQAKNRDFTLVTNGDPVPVNNRLSRVAIGQTEIEYVYDDNGNLVREALARHFEWDHSDRMKAFRTQTGTAEPSIHAHYLYDATGQRVMKWVRRPGEQVDVTVYVDGIFEHHRQITLSGTQENNTLHVMDDQQRIALVRVGEPFSNDSTPAVKFQLNDRLGSSNVVIDNSGELINREEYTPYGETSFGSFARKRYRFTGKERDEESGLNYHKARYYASWLSRWSTVDPLADEYFWQSPYTYGSNSPVNKIDPTGEGDFYSQDGFHLGTDNISDNKVYVSTQKAIENLTKEDKTDWDAVKLLDVTVNLTNKYGVTHEEFLDRAHWAYGESAGAKEIIDYYAHAINNIIKEFKQDSNKYNNYKRHIKLGFFSENAPYRLYKEFFKYRQNLNRINREENINVRNSIAATIGAITESTKNPVGNSIYWKGGKTALNILKKNETYQNKQLKENPLPEPLNVNEALFPTISNHPHYKDFAYHKTESGKRTYHHVFYSLTEEGEKYLRSRR
ncbi:MAG TPA: SpvB/TcaC N-terminal domain-containing protein [Leptolyngbyaceae cyanobacterium]